MYGKMPEEFWILILMFVAGLAFSVISILMAIIWRFIRRKPIFLKGEQIESKTFYTYIGIETLIFMFLCIACFIKWMPYFGTSFFLFIVLEIFGLFSYKKGWIK